MITSTVSHQAYSADGQVKAGDPNSENPPAIVAILVAQSVKAGASVAQVARATGRPIREIRQMLETVDLLESLITEETGDDLGPAPYPSSASSNQGGR